MFSVASPLGDEWRLRYVNFEMSRVGFIHADTESVLVADWRPVFACDHGFDARWLTRNLWESEMIDTFKVSSNYTIVAEHALEKKTIDGRRFDRFGLHIAALKNKKPINYDCEALFMAAASSNDVFVFFLSIPGMNESTSNRFLQALYELAATCRPASAPPAQVAQLRSTIALVRYLRMADAPEATQAPDQLRCLRRDALAEATLASLALPRSPDPWIAQAHLAERNEQHLLYGDGFEALRVEESYREAIRRRPSSYNAHTGLAELYEHTGHDSAAQDEWRAAIEAQPSAAEPYYRLGKLYEKQSRRTEALVNYRQALRFWRGDPQIRKQLEKTVTELGKQAQ